MTHRPLSFILLCASFALLQGCKSPSGGQQSGLPVPQIPGVPQTSIPGIPSIPGGSASIPGSSIPGQPGGKPGSESGGKPGGQPGGEPGGPQNSKEGGKKSGKNSGKQGGQTAGVPGAPGGGGSGGPSNNPNGNTPEQGDDWLGGDNAGGEDEWATSNTLPGGKGSDQTGASDPLGDVANQSQSSSGELDKALDNALEDFDGEILAERDAILKRNQRTASTSDRGGKASGNPGSQGGAGGSGESGSGNGKAPPNPSDRKYEPSTRPPPSAPNSAARGDRVVPDTPDATDDDVLARQLREAATNEVDPELKEKLWEEYRRYKGSS